MSDAPNVVTFHQYQSQGVSDFALEAFLNIVHEILVSRGFTSIGYNIS